MNLQELKILLVEDKTLDLCAIKQGLLKLECDGSDRIQDSNIISLKIKSDSDLQGLVSEIKEINPDILFIDLHLVSDIKDGIGIIRQLIDNSSELKYLPKYIISEAHKVYGNHNLQDIFQYAHPIIKPEVKTLRGSESEQCKTLATEYYNLFEATHQLSVTLPVVASMYKAIQKKFEISESLDNILYKVDNLEIKNDQTIGILHSQVRILNKIIINTEEIKQKTELIEIITTATAKALPKIADKGKAERLLREWETNDELVKIFGDDFPQLPQGLINTLKEIVDNISDETKKKPIEDIAQMLYDGAKEYIVNVINEKAKVNSEDTKLLILTKYGGLLINSILRVSGISEK